MDATAEREAEEKKKQRKASRSKSGSFLPFHSPQNVRPGVIHLTCTRNWSIFFCSHAFFLFSWCYQRYLSLVSHLWRFWGSPFSGELLGQIAPIWYQLRFHKLTENFIVEVLFCQHLVLRNPLWKKIYMLGHSCSCISFSVMLDFEFMNTVICQCVSLGIRT